MCGRMNDVKSYVPPFRLDESLEGGAIGEVTESRLPDLAEGDLVLDMLGWRDEAVLPARQARKVTPDKYLSPSAYLGVLDNVGADHLDAALVLLVEPWPDGHVRRDRQLQHHPAARGTQQSRPVRQQAPHAARVDRHGQVADPDLPVGQVGPGRLGQREVLLGRHAGGS